MKNLRECPNLLRSYGVAFFVSSGTTADYFGIALARIVFSLSERNSNLMLSLKGVLIAALSALALVALFATNAISMLAQVFCLFSVVVFVGTSLLGLAAKLRA